MDLFKDESDRVGGPVAKVPRYGPGPGLTKLISVNGVGYTQCMKVRCERTNDAVEARGGASAYL